MPRREYNRFKFINAHANHSSVSLTRAVASTLALVILASPSAIGTTGASTPTGSMSAGRGSAAVAIVANMVLVAAGDVPSSSAELFDPGTGTFSVTGTLNAARAGAAVVGFVDGRVLIAGGWDGSAAVRTAELYDPVQHVFLPAGDMNVGRIDPAAVRLLDGRVLLAGGRAGNPQDGYKADASADIYDPQSGAFVATGSMAIARTTSAALLPDGRVLVAGGEDADGIATGSAELYDPAIGTFSATGSLGVPRRDHQATVLADGRVLITGGMDGNQTAVTDAELYDPSSGTFSSAGHMVAARVNHRAVLFDGGTVLVFGGRGADGGVLAGAEIYDPRTGLFTSVPGLNEPRLSPSVATLPDGRVLIAGGRGVDGQVLATAEIYGDVTPPAQPTTVSVASSANPAVYGDTLIYTAAVTALTEAPQGRVRFLDGDTLDLGTAVLDAAGMARLSTPYTPAGDRSITAVYEGSERFEGSTSQPYMQSVGKAPTSSTLTVSPWSQQYSDNVTFEATVSGARGDRPADGVTFKIGTQTMNDEPVPLVHTGGGVWKARLTTPLLEKAPAGQLRPNAMTKIATASFSGVSPNYTVANPSAKALLINKEDARVTYTGPATVSTTSRTSGAATIPLRATVRDIAATSEHNADGTVGDIRLARVTFINRTTSAIIATVTVTLADPDDTSTGVAAYDWHVDIGTAKSKSYTVGMIVSDYYSRNSTADDATITVSKQR